MLPNATTNNIRAQFIAESMSKGMSFELALEKSFKQVNDFLMSLVNNPEFNRLVFETVNKKNIFLV